MSFYPSSSDFPEITNRDKSKMTVLYVPVEGEIKVLPWTSFSALPQILESVDYEGIAFPDMNLVNKGYRLAGFIRTHHGRNIPPINKRCSKLYITGIPGPVVIMSEESEGQVPLTEADIPIIFYQEQDLQ